MIKFEHTEVVGWEHAIRGMRNPLESWEKSDSHDSFEPPANDEILVEPGHYAEDHTYILGPNDANLMTKLRNAGTDHRKFMRMIVVYVDITAPLYWWKEFDTYKVGTVANSCSTMHCIHKKEFDISDFSCEHLINETFTGEVVPEVLLGATIKCLNENRAHYLSTKDKKYWWQMIQLLPTSYNQKRTVMLNYEVLANIYNSRKDHKLTEWHDFCDWIKELPYSELIVGKPSRKNYTFADAARNLKNFAETYEKQHTPSPEEIDKLFKQVVKLDERIDSYGVFDMDGMKILDFYDGDHNSLYAVDLYRATLSDTLAFIKQQVVKRT